MLQALKYGHAFQQIGEALRRVVARVAVLNLCYFGFEFGVALAIGSVSLFADSIDFLAGHCRATSPSKCGSSLVLDERDA